MSQSFRRKPNLPDINARMLVKALSTPPVARHTNPSISAMLSISCVVVTLLLMIAATGQALPHKQQRDDSYAPDRLGCETLLERREW